MIWYRFAKNFFKLYSNSRTYHFLEEDIEDYDWFEARYKKYGTLIWVLIDKKYRNKWYGGFFHNETAKKVMEAFPDLEGLCFTYSTSNTNIYNPEEDYNFYEDKLGWNRIAEYESNVTKNSVKIPVTRHVVTKTREEILGSED